MTADPEQLDVATVVAACRRREGASFASFWRALGESGAFADFVSPSGLRRGCERLEALGYHHPDLGVFISVISGCGLALPILARAGGDIGEKLLQGVVAGRQVMAVAITEPSAGSDALAMQCALRREGESLVLNGRKWNITNAPIADWVIVFCRDETTPARELRAVLVPAGAPGVTRPPPQRLIGCKSSPTGELLFERVAIDRAWVLPEDGKALLELAFLRERVLGPWPLLGKMARVIQEALDHVATREQFGARLESFQYVQEKIVSSYERLSSARLLASRAVDALVDGGPIHALASLAKYHATDAGVFVFRTIMEAHGSYGLQQDASLGEYLGDALCATVAGGTREVHKKVLFEELRLDRARSRRRGRSALFHLSAPRAITKEGS